MLLLKIIYLSFNCNYLIKSCVGLCNNVYSMKIFTHLEEKNKRNLFTRSYFWKIMLPEYEMTSLEIA
jgi:hypothetical protein